MEQWIRHALSADHLGAAALPAAFLLGILGSLASCCALPLIGAVAGYAGAMEQRRHRSELLVIGVFFAIGAIVSLTALGAIAGFVGEVAGAALGKYWRLAAGLVMVLFGLVALDLLQLRLSLPIASGPPERRSIVGALAYGLALGGATTACSFGCNPLLPVALGAAVLKGTTLLGLSMLVLFAIGYSLPLSAGFVGIGLGVGRLGRLATRLIPAARAIGGSMLVVIGFYLLAGA